jgi:DNA gyrase inhibitor GyrI
MKKQLLNGHQGDVQFKQVGSLPAGAKKVDNRPIAYGEHSGHQHVLTGDVEMFELDGRLVAVVGGDGARLQHIHESKMTTTAWKSIIELDKADHSAHLLPKGIYEFYIQNAYNPYSKLMEKVID